MLGSLISSFGLSNPVDPDKFLTLWPTFLAVSSKVDFPEGKKPSKMFEFPGVQGVVACREQMLALEISPGQAAAYGTRLSLTKGILDESELAEKLSAYIVAADGGARDLSPALVKACAVTKLKSSMNGPRLDVADLLERAQAFSVQAIA